MSRVSGSIIQALNPADYFTLAMDEEIRREGMPGSLCGFALELSGHPDIDRLNTRIDLFSSSFPSARTCLQKIGRRFYWCHREKRASILFLHRCSAGQDEQNEFHVKIQRVMNRIEARETVNPLEFHLFQGNTESVLLIRWIHPFCDAVGADLILKFLAADQPLPENACCNPQVSLLNQQLGRFSLWQKFKLLLKAKKLIEQIDRYHSILPSGCMIRPQRLNFSVFRLSRQHSRKIAQSSLQQVGLIGSSLYTIGCLMRAIERMESRSAGDAYCVPYAFNLRKQKALGPVTGNHVSALFAQAPVEIVRNRDRLFRYLTDQYRHSIREQLDYAFLPLMRAAQWLSLERYGKALRQSYRGGQERSSFWFSDTGRSDLAGQNIFGARISGLFHLAQVSTPPGLALLTGIFENRLSLTYNFVEPLFDSEWIGRLHQEVLAELLGDSP
ncbi:MAG: hypothetical protein L0Y43_05585 [Methylococcaceae bacterium]|nr:hypothetical protein [Methylococcaceae bacterium]